MRETLKRIDLLVRADLHHFALNTLDNLYTLLTSKNLLSREAFLVYASLASLQPHNPSLIAHFEGYVEHYFCA